MKVFKKFFLVSVIAALTIPAMAGVLVTLPVNNAQVASPFTLSATSSTCLAQKTVSMGYSLDSSSVTTIVEGTSLHANVVSAVGAHTLHVKSWGHGTACVTNIALTVTKAPQAGPVVPAGAIASGNIQTLDTWYFAKDAGTPGTGTGESGMVSTPSRSGNARQFFSTYTNAGGERYSVDYASDTTSMNFVYDAWVWIDAGSSVANLEMDSNQVTANGQTVIYAFQCSDYTKTWEYSGAGAKWISSKQACNLANWETNAWHHVQISYSRDSSGNVTYHAVWLDGAEQAINATVPSSFALGWKIGVVQTQFQLDGIGASGTSTVYLDDLTISRW